MGTSGLSLTSSEARKGLWLTCGCGVPGQRGTRPGDASFQASLLGQCGWPQWDPRRGRVEAVGSWSSQSHADWIVASLKFQCYVAHFAHVDLAGILGGEHAAWRTRPALPA